MDPVQEQFLPRLAKALVQAENSLTKFEVEKYGTISGEVKALRRLLREAQDVGIVEATLVA